MNKYGSKIQPNPDFSPSQNEALVALNKNTIVSAGAGSGKTTVLSAKVKALVEDEKISVDKMLILTFTNLAAQEMRDRIKNKLMGYDFAEALKVDTSDICTFDSFALSIVKKYHFLLGLDENISVISNVIVSANRNKWVDELFERLYNNEDERFLSLVDRIALKDDSRVKELIIKVIEKADLFDDKELYFSPVSKEKAEEEFEKIFIPFASRLMQLKKEMYEAFERIENKKYYNKVYEMNKDFFEARDFDALINGIKSFSLIGTGGFKLDPDQKSQFVAIKDKIITDNYEKLSDKATLKNEYLSAQDYKNYIKELAKIIVDKESEFKYLHQSFTFSDIANFAYKIVNENVEILNSLKDKYDIIMVDEYQDTSYSQERFLKLIEKNNMFMVGDIKQSIYRFRNARPDIFLEKYDEFAKGEKGIKIDLNDNFRSRKEVLNDINLIFKNIMTMEWGGANYARDHVINSGNKLYDTTSIVPPKTQALIYENSKDYDGDKRAEIEANIIANDIIKKLNSGYEITEFYEEKAENGKKVRKARAKKASYSSFCIIHAATSEFPIYVKVFESKGIPIFVQSNEEVSTNSLIRISINALSLIEKMINKDEDNDEFRHCIVSLSRSYIFNETDETIYNFVKNNEYRNTEVYKTFERIVSKSSNDSIVEKLELFLDETDAFYKLLRIGNYERNSAYLESFISYFEEMDNLNYSLNDAIEVLKCIDKYKIKLQLPPLETSVDAVKLINAHKSKGLEYNFVYFSNIFKQMNCQDINKSYNVSLKYDISFNFKNGDLALDHMLFKEEEKKEAISEYLRLFYVALTRAKEQMIFVYYDEANEKNIAKCLSFLDFLKSSRFVVFEEKIDDPYENISLLNMCEEDISSRIEIKPIEFDVNEDKKVHKSSASLSLDSSASSLNLGSDIHFLFRAVDFKNKDLSGLSRNDKSMISRFFNSTLFKYIEHGEFYKEYEFENESNKGVIDLFAVLENEIVIVDYKLKNISKEEYVNQLNIYAKHLTKVFNKPIKAYLYAIFTGEIQEVTLNI